MGNVLVCYEPHTGVATAESSPVIEHGAIVTTRSSGATSIHDYTRDGEEGCRIVDKQPVYDAVDFEVFADMVVHCPLPDTKLRPGYMRDAMEIEGTSLFPGIDRVMDGHHLTVRDVINWVNSYCLMYVAVDAYAAIWRVAGARIGVIRGGVIVWEE